MVRAGAGEGRGDVAGRIYLANQDEDTLAGGELKVLAAFDQESAGGRITGAGLGGDVAGVGDGGVSRCRRQGREGLPGK